MTDGPIANYWPAVPSATYTILREVAQERQRQAEIDAVAGPLPPGACAIVASILCEDYAPREILLRCVAMIVLEIERRDAAINV
jgi:hypothetical protein